MTLITKNLTAVEQYEMKLEGIIHQMRNPYNDHFVNPNMHDDLVRQYKIAEQWLTYFKEIEQQRKDNK